MKLIFDFNKKRFKFLSIFSIGLHILGALFVLHSLAINTDDWLEYMNWSRLLIGLEKYNHRISTILNVWMIGIQIRYVITDFLVFISSLQNKKLLLYTIKVHGIESFICSIVFFSHYSHDCFIFGIICFCWTILWSIAYFILI